MRPERAAMLAWSATQATKNPAEAGFLFDAIRGQRALGRAAGRASGGLEGLDAGVQAGLVTGGLVLVDEATRAEAIEDRLREQDYLLDPDVSIQVLTHRPFYVVGEVAQPGAYEYVAGMTLANAVALAGGYTYRADRSSVAIVHGDCVRDATAVTRVWPGEIVRVPERFF